MLRASIDLGTNTCLMLIAEVESGQIKKVMDDYARIIRLGEGVDKTGSLQPVAMERAISCLAEYRKIVDEAGIAPDEVVCVATSQARDAKNGEVLFSRLENECGFRFKVLSGKDEARMSFLGSLLPGMTPSRYVVVDIGGGSTEYVTANEDHSIDLGSVRFTERYLQSDPVTDKEFCSCLEEIDRKLEKLAEWRRTMFEDMKMLAVAGTATTLASWYLGLKKFDATEIEKVQLTINNVHQMVEGLKCMTVAERREQAGIEPKRADVLLAGAMIVWRTMWKLNFPVCNISSRGLRYGALL